MQSPKNTNPNNLIQEQSLYLKQHAYNPVNWNSWSPDILDIAKKENKPLLISIGYAACHWCHVMEHECFEDEETATLMNTHYINIKIDREEHPDIDQTYMNALQLMQNSGGWPLNIIALPDGSPFWGATYVPRDQWKTTLKQIAHIYNNNFEKIIEYSKKLKQGLTLFNTTEKPENTITSHDLLNTITILKERWDLSYGGFSGAPKFMMPAHFNFLLTYNFYNQDENISNFLKLSLDKMAYGGLYDIIGGGFSRYSVDETWHIPHFEKMLYDNCQLITIYTNLYQTTQNKFYKKIAEQTLEFVNRDLSCSETKLAYTALDADSLNSQNKKEEGAFYCWRKEELQQLLLEKYDLFAKAFNINNIGYWEHNNYVLYRTLSNEQLALELQKPIETITETLEQCRTILYNSRKKRPHPALDDKIITGWNGMYIEALITAYFAFNNTTYLNRALVCCKNVEKHLFTTEGNLLRTLNPNKAISGNLEDYAWIITAYLSVYEATGNTHWLTQSRMLMDICLDEFYDLKSHMFYYTSASETVLVQRNIEMADNVIPASNSVMAFNLKKLYFLFSNEHYKSIYQNMLKVIKHNAVTYPASYTNWLRLATTETNNFYEVIIIGKDAKEKQLELKSHFLPNIITAISTTPSDNAIFKNRYIEDKTLLYICKNNSCNLPVSKVTEALKQLT